MVRTTGTQQQGQRMTVQPPPRETTAQRRRRLLTDARRLTNDIDAALSEYGDNTQEENRRRADAEIERSFPGVTEDEQNPTGMYMPDPKYYPRGENIRADSNYSETHQPMRRRLTKNVQGTTDFTSNDFTLGGEVAPWSYKEEMDYLEAARRAANTNIVGTGEWAESLTPDKIEEHSGYAPFEYNQAGWTSDEVENALDRGHEAPLSDQELWVRGELSSRRSASRYEVPTTRDVREGRDDRIQLFRGDMVADVEKSQNAPHEIDLRNVRDWAEKHRKEVSETGIEDTEWKERFAKLKEDVVNTVVPINPQEVNSESRHILAKARVENKTIILNGSLSATTVTVIVPNIEKDYVIINNSGGTATISSGGSTTVSIGTGSKNYVIVDPSTTSVISAVPAATPGGSNYQVQYNNNGAFGAISNGTTGQILTSNGSGATPSFQANTGITAGKSIALTLVFG